MIWKGLPARNEMLRNENYSLAFNAKSLEQVNFLRVVEYNLHAETYGWGPDRFEPCDPAPELNKLNADVYVLPELWVPDSSESPGSHLFSWAEETGRTLHTARSSRATPRQAKGQAGESHIAIATNLPVLETQKFKLPKHSKDNSVERNVIAVLLDAPWGTPLWVLGVHMSATVPHVPIHNLLNLAGFLTDLEATGHPVIISGDFNLWGWWVRSLHRKRYYRAVKGRTWPSYRPHSQIDHILTRDTLSVAESGVLPVGFSDHRAIYAALKPT